MPLLLENAIDVACNDLNTVLVYVEQIGAASTLGLKSATYFRQSAEQVKSLRDAKVLISLRALILHAVRTFPERVSSNTPGKYLYNDVEVTFKQGRFLLFQSYLVNTWAIYDLVVKVAGMICCTDEFAKNDAVPVRLVEHVLLNGKCLGARVQSHLRDNYGQPIALSYYVRNWLVHDGHCHKGVELFRFEEVSDDPFQLSDGAIASIESKVKEEFGSRVQPRVSLQRNLFDGLMACHSEADEAVGLLLTWASAGIRLQAKMLFERDVAAPVLASVAVTQ